MERWVEHYSKLYCREYSISDSTLDAVECLPIMEEQDVLPTAEELNKAIDSLPTRKPEAIKYAKGILLNHLHELPYQCWKEGGVQHDMRDCNII